MLIQVWVINIAVCVLVLVKYCYFLTSRDLFNSVLATLVFLIALNAVHTLEATKFSNVHVNQPQ